MPMTMRYLMSRIGAQLGVLSFAVVIYSPFYERSEIIEQSTIMNGFVYTFLAASLPPVWHRDITLKIRLAALAVGAIVAIPIGVTYFAFMGLIPYVNRSLLALLYGALVALVGPAIGWVTSCSIISWMSKPATPHSGDTDQKGPNIVSLPPHASVPPTLAVNSKEVKAFRFLLIAWGIGLLTLALSGSSYLMSNRKQSELDSMSLTIESCTKEVFRTTPDCNIPFSESDGTCSNVEKRCYGYEWQKLINERGDWDDRADNFLYLAPWLLILPTLLFYGIRWALTGRLRPLWLLRRHGVNTPKMGNG